MKEQANLQNSNFNEKNKIKNTPKSKTLIQLDKTNFNKKSSKKKLQKKNIADTRRNQSDPINSSQKQIKQRKIRQINLTAKKDTIPGICDGGHIQIDTEISFFLLNNKNHETETPKTNLNLNRDTKGLSPKSKIWETLKGVIEREKMDRERTSLAAAKGLGFWGERVLFHQKQWFK